MTQVTVGQDRAGRRRQKKGSEGKMGRARGRKVRDYLGRKEERESKVRRSHITRLIQSKFPGTMSANRSYP